ncbi:MAG TPA: amidohydrolase family protein [Gemmataceae bacterium]|jgi:cytosine/adenosine deaminase-related metal-dependent hydrolase
MFPSTDSPQPPWTLSARWLLPVSGPPIAGGGLTIAGERIVAVEPAGERPVDVDLGEVAVLPGLVNAHTHLDLTGLRGRCPPSADFTGWLRQVIAHRRSVAPEQIEADIRAGLAESLRFGTTLLGDISGDGGSWDVLVKAPLRAVVFREMLGLPEARASEAWERLDRWLESRSATPTCRPGVSPHAPYSVRSSLFFAASIRSVPVAVHVAETAAEQELLMLCRGPFVSFLRDLDVWAPDGLVEDTDHVLRLLTGLSPTLLVHGNYLPPDSAIPPNASIVYCPRTHAAFGHPPHPFRDFLARGVRVALGTDSLASNPDLSILAEMRFLHERRPDVPGDVLLRMATLTGAEALGWADETGSLDAGKSADLVVVPLAGGENGDPHQRVLASDLPVQRVMYRGQWT